MNSQAAGEPGGASTSRPPVEDWEIWAGSSCACVVPATDPDKAWLTRVMVLKYRMPGVTEDHAVKVFARALRGGYLIDLPRGTPAAQQPEDGPSEGS